MADPDAWLGGRLHLHQPPPGAHRAGTDAVLLAHLVAPEPGSTVCDLGAGAGAVGLAVAALNPACRVVLVEREATLVELARANVALNGLGDRASVIEADILAAATARHAAGLLPGLADLVVTNPPYFDEARHRPSPVAGKRDAHSFGAGDLDGWLRTCTDVLGPKGRLGLIHRADALEHCLEALRARFGGLAIRPVHARADRPAIRILVTATKASRAPTSLLPPLVLQQADGRFTPEAQALHRGAGLPTT
ncbi:methyltransferase [Methylobacterium sp. Leaf108]|uniref:tRNA1(Val) (adenine(37)-N6)-methyltransferase n=1 Tax=Methylobacterium sp. Leaf108 TaxID=1736256 RepID=UPI0006FBB811|nr:methyltransferase [Methylobacterium sp. Leaf108]KQP51756.1 methyltransferase [Methylobacterium sp. Leaf108]